MVYTLPSDDTLIAMAGQGRAMLVIEALALPDVDAQYNRLYDLCDSFGLDIPADAVTVSSLAHLLGVHCLNYANSYT